MSIAITTDSNSGILQSECTSHLFVLAMPFLIDDKEYLEGLNLTVEKFFEFQLGGSNITTSQASITSVEDLWHEALKTHDYVIHIPMSSSLSSSCDTAKMIAQDEPFAGKVFVVDNQRISVTQKECVYEALQLAQQGYAPKQIVDYLMQNKQQSSIYIMVPDLKYIKKGGRITKTAAAIGSILQIKPVLQIQGGKLDSYAKVMTVKQAKDKMIAAIKHDIETRFANILPNQKLELCVAYTYNKLLAQDFANEVQSHFPNLQIKHINPLSLSVSCHIGPNCLAVTCSAVLK